MIQSKHAVYGTAILRNGVPIAWLQFESGKLTHKEAEQAALQQQGYPSSRCYVGKPHSGRRYAVRCMQKR